MTESGYNIDWACHANDAASIHDVLEMSNARGRGLL